MPYIDETGTYLRIKEIASALGVCRATVTRMMDRNAFEVWIRMVSPSIQYVKLEDVEAFRERIDAARNDPDASRRSMRYRRWRLSVLERDDFTCQECGIMGVSMHAHHVMPWATHRELRFDVSNGVTLCSDCHQMQHRFPLYAGKTSDQHVGVPSVQAELRLPTEASADHLATQG